MEKNIKGNAEESSVKPGFVITIPRLSHTVWIVISFFVLTSLLALIVGYINRFGWPANPLSSPTTSITFVQSTTNVVVMNELGNGYSRVLVRKAGIPGWILISADDFNAYKPSLSSNGMFIAYLSMSSNVDDSKVVVTSLEEDRRLTILPQAIDGMRLTPAPIKKFVLCPWTNIAWSPNSQQIAFFVCATEPNSSYVAITNPVTIGSAPVIIPESYLSSEDTREVMWLTSDQIIVNQLMSTGPATIDTNEFTVPASP